MALTSAFFDAINNRDIRLIRIMMKDSLLVDLSFKEFKEMETAAAKVHGLYDAHDGHEFITDESAWDDNYMDKQMVHLVRNFSHERIEHLKEVIRVLRPFKHPAGGVTNSNTAEARTSGASRSYEEQKQFHQQNGIYKGVIIVGGAVAGSVVGGVVLTAIGGAVAVGAVAGAVVGGVIASAVVLGGKK